MAGEALEAAVFFVTVADMGRSASCREMITGKRTCLDMMIFAIDNGC